MLPKHLRIKKKAEYKALFKNSIRVYGKFVSLDFYASSVKTLPKFGITAPKKHGPATARNRFKRIAREAFRLIYRELPDGLQIHVCPRSRAKSAKTTDIAVEIRKLIGEVQS